MWNIVDTSGMGNSSPLWGPSLSQKRNLHFNFANVAIAPGKYFNNPNFVNKNNPNIHNYHNAYSSSERLCQIDNSKEDNKDCSVVNSSKNIEELDSQNKTNSSEQTTQDTTDMCYSKKPSKKNHRNRRRKRHNRHSNCNKNQRDMYEMMDEDIEIESSQNNSVVTSNSNIPNTLCLEDFMVEQLTNDSQSSVENNCINCPQTEFMMSSTTPPNICFLSCIPRKRQNSIAESEDSFIVFDSGTDDELDFSEESEDESGMDEENDSISDEESESEFEEDLDSSSSVIPTKRVRFAEENELCEVHPMVQWAYAYKQARKGPWEVFARDRSRFKKRVDETETILTPILDCKHREKVFQERFQDLEM